MNLNEQLGENSYTSIFSIFELPCAVTNRAVKFKSIFCVSSSLILLCGAVKSIISLDKLF